jgi:hypothetical protein
MIKSSPSPGIFYFGLIQQFPDIPPTDIDMLFRKTVGEDAANLALSQLQYFTKDVGDANAQAYAIATVADKYQKFMNRPTTDWGWVADPVMGFTKDEVTGFDAYKKQNDGFAQDVFTNQYGNPDWVQAGKDADKAAAAAAAQQNQTGTPAPQPAPTKFTQAQVEANTAQNMAIPDMGKPRVYEKDGKQYVEFTKEQLAFYTDHVNKNAERAKIVNPQYNAYLNPNVEGKYLGLDRLRQMDQFAGINPGNAYAPKTLTLADLGGADGQMPTNVTIRK